MITLKPIIVLAILLMLCGKSFSQQGWKWNNVFSKKDVAPTCLMFASGFMDGFAESLRYHYPKVDAKFRLNDEFWNPSVSWTNKYQNNDPAQGPAYFGSTTFLAWTTDGYHLTRMMRNVTAITAITIKIGDRQKWYAYIIEGVIYYFTYSIGFTLSYDYIFNQTDRR